ncbi:MAG: DNA topoisomerase (ATP-hydrolyzing) subunit B, partial [Clostridia bacterium]|nr:DNA topoisomerase (ATP-hydrolyzing) subunit B [Clostridia bacterium]
MTEQPVTQEYNEEQIQVLKGLEAVRVRPGMYIGTTSTNGLHHLVNEIVDNSIDEAMAGYCDTIEVNIHKDGSLSVRDNGRGIPSGINADTGKPTLEVVFTVLHAGGKFGGGGYKISGGLHGVGASVVNALSKWMEVENCHGGKKSTERFERGEVARPFEEVGDCGDEHGLYVRFMPDATIFEDVVFDFEKILKRMREQAFLNAGIKIIVTDLRHDEPLTETLCYEGGLKSYVEYINERKHCDLLHEDVIYIKGQKGDMTAEIAMQYNTAYDEMIISFANNMATIDGGMHETGFKTALTKVTTQYAKKIKVLKDTDKDVFDGSDVRSGLTAVISVKLPDAQFESQTKAKLGNSEVRTFVNAIVTTKLEEFFEENPDTARLIIDKIYEEKCASERARQARDESRNRKGALESFSLPGKLADCHERSVDLTELFIVEGDSAGGSAKDGRNSRFQAILPLRGKILNVEKSRLDKVYANQSVLPIIQALGCGIGPDFDINKLRYGKIIIMADADVDGSHIRILLLTFFYRFMRGLIEGGHVYSAMPPLYKIVKGKNTYYAYNDADRDRIIEEIGGAGRVDRYKGLGEMSKDQLWETTMDPENRTIIRMTIEDAMQCDEIFSALMGDKVDPRREFIEQNAKFV